VAVSGVNTPGSSNCRPSWQSGIRAINCKSLTNFPVENRWEEPLKGVGRPGIGEAPALPWQMLNDYLTTLWDNVDSTPRSLSVSQID
jgi:hypothetical protein